MNALAIVKTDNPAPIFPADEKSLLRFCEDELEAEMQALPAAFAEYLENTDEYACSRAELLEAIRMAPNKLARQILYSEYRFRDYLTMVSGPEVGCLGV